ncbi:non-ribosomal peptide synthetase, partial [Janthinobacterium sp. PC23-8]|uniref:non-ribosomal peptide synthetase n=1 Tax=Janthinobacterium sp. PC23-8 TaxID=2012679 RepID=UPI000BD64BFE
MTASHPVTRAQRELILVSLLHPESSLGNTGGTATIHGPLDTAAMCQGAARLVARHEIFGLGLTISAEHIGHRPVARTAAMMQMVDYSAHADGAARARAFIAQQFATPIELAGDAALMRNYLIRIDAGHHVWLCYGAHALLDGWSFSLLFKQLAQDMQQHLAQDMQQLADAAQPAPSFLEYVAEERLWEEGSARQRSLSYWQQRFPSAPQPLFAPIKPFQLASRMLASPVAWSRYAQWGRDASAAGVSLVPWITAALLMTLARHGGVTRPVLGMPLLGRRTVRHKQTMGLFANVVPLAVTVEPQQSLAQLAARVAEQQRADYRHARITPNDIARPWSQEDGGAGFVEATLSFERHDYTDMFPACTHRVAAFSPLQQRRPLQIYLREYQEGEEVDFDLYFNLSYFTDATAQALRDDWLALLDGRLAEGGLAAPMPQAALPAGAVADLWRGFEAQALRDGAATALVDADGRHVSYAELHQQARRIGAALAARALGAESRVGLAAGRHAGLIAGLLGILAAGAAYVPLDPRYPAERLAYLAGDAQLGCVLADAEGAAALAAAAAGTDWPAPPLLLLDELARAPAPDAWIAPPIHAAQAAYVIYTSGSTGQPKGCVVSHGNVASLMASAVALHGYGRDDVWTLFHSCAFDFSVWEIWGALLLGARLVLVPHAVSRDPERLHALLAQQGVTVLNQTPTAFRSLLAVDAQLAADAAAPALALRRVIFGGEALEPSMLAGWYARHGAATELINMYGITETTVHVTSRTLNEGDLARGSVIGAALPGWRLYLLDAAMQPVAAGLTGELYVGGAGVTRGYLGRAALCAERFLPDPFAADGSRMYRSGDLGRVNADGELEYLGRADQQVKIRGYRIELGEIESALGSHPQVRDAVVLALDGDGGKRLVAWLTPVSPGGEVAEEALRGWLGERLPEHMLPSALLWLERLPLTANGKLDRAALAQPQRVAPTLAQAAPRTALERLLAGLWQEVLGRTQVGRDDNFFALGGDSILALRLVARIREQGHACSAREIFQHPTPAALAPLLGQAVAQGQDGDGFDARLTPIEAWFFDLPLAERNHWNQAVALEFDASLTQPQVADAVARQVRRHAAFFWRWRADGAAWRVEQDWSAPRHVWLSLPAGSSDAEAVQLAQRHIGIADDALSACAWIEAGAGPARLLWLVHHLAVDALSWHVLLGGLGAALAGVQAPAAAPVSTRARRLAARSGSAPAPWPHWSDAGAPAPFDGAAGSYGAQCKRSLLIDGATWHAVREAQKHGLRLEELLLAATAQALCAISGRADIALALEQHGRDLDARDAGAGAEVGWFTVIAPLLLTAPPQAGPLDWLANVVDALAAWTPRAADWLALRPAMAPDARQLPAISFNYLGNFATAPSVAGMTLLPLPELALHDPHGGRPFAHDLLAWSDGAGLHLQWLYHGALHQGPQVDAWLAAIATALAQLAQQLLHGGPRLPVLALQEGLVYHAANDAGTHLPSYLGQVRGQIDGALEPARFAAAWEALLRRHTALRTRFYWQGDGRVRQQVEPAAALPLRQIDLRGLDAASAEQALRQALAVDHRKPFALDKAPLMRLLLARLDQQRWAFGWTHHHAIVDGWSLPVVLADLLALYDADHDLPTAPACTPADLVRYRLSRDAAAAQAAWQVLLAPLDGPCRLARGPAERGPTERGPTERGPTDGADADLALTLAPALGAELGALAASHGLTLNCLFLTAWTLTVAACSDTATPCFGVTVSGRDAPLAGIEQLVGLAINTLPMAVALDPAESLIALAQRVQLTLASMQAHAGMALPALQRLAGQPGQELFDTLYVFENYPHGALAGRELTVSGIDMAERAHYPVTLAVLPGTGIALRLALRGGVGAAFGQALLGRLHATLQALAGTPLHAVGLPLMPAPSAPSGEPAGSGSEGSPGLVDIFERSAQAFPEAPALACGEQRWSYRELDAQAERACAELQRRGIGAETLVALCARRTPQLIACLLGVAKAGAAFLPLDADLPPARLQATLARSGAALLLADAHGASAPEGMACVALDTLLAAPATARVRTAASVDALAYVIYTSGSSGVPKGVEVSQRGLHNLMRAQQDACRIGSDARIYQFASIGFDAAISEILMAFGAGAMLCLPDGGRGVLDIDFEADLRRHRPTHITLPPSLLASLAPSALDSVHTLLVAGERTSAAQLLPWRAPGRRLINAYGPTEASVCASMETWHGEGDPVLGWPMAGVTMHLFDGWMRPVDDGVIGELYLGGPGLARGYRGQPGLSAAAFVPDPSGSQPGQRLYRSGDLACRLGDGRLVYAGRRDEQIKVRGQRIEPGEVEAVLAGLPGARRVRVGAWREGLQPMRLAAWIEDPHGQLDLALLAHAAARLLTPAMLPALWALVPEWPLNASGKVDMRRLPPPQPLAAADAGGAGAAAHDADVLAAVIAAWADTLGLAQVTAATDFYAAGGDSISAMRIASRLRGAGYHLQPRDIMQAGTPLALARAMALAPTEAPLAPPP